MIEKYNGPDVIVPGPGPDASRLIESMEQGLVEMAGLGPSSAFGGGDMASFVKFYDERSSAILPITVQALAWVTEMQTRFPDSVNFAAAYNKVKVHMQYGKIGANTDDFTAGVSSFALREMAKAGVGFNVSSSKQGS
jgi:hypothetical protein